MRKVIPISDLNELLTHSGPVVRITEELYATLLLLLGPDRLRTARAEFWSTLGRYYAHTYWVKKRFDEQTSKPLQHNDI